MNACRWFCGLVVVVGLAALSGSSFAQDDKDAKLEFKAFDKGKPAFYQELVTTTTQKMKVMGQAVEQKQNQTFYIKWTPKDPEGQNLVVDEEIIGVKMDIDIGGNKISYDSTLDEKAQPQNPMNDFFKALKSLKLTLVIEPGTMAVKEIKGRDEFIKKLGETNPQMKPLLESILGLDALKQMAQPTWGAVPNKQVKAGETWDVKSSLNLGAIGVYKTTFKYKLESQDKDKAKIGVTADLIYDPPTAQDKSSTLPFKIKDKSKLESKSSKGEVTFDRTKGRIEKSTMEMKLEGDLIIEVGGADTTVNLEQTQNSVMNTLDSDPTTKKTEETKKQ